jgi:hypothetical protein
MTDPTHREDLMAIWVWAVIVIAAVAVIALIALGARKRRTAKLRQRFGPEYDRAVEAREDRRAAEADLRSRERQRAQFDIKPLPEATRLRFADEWREVQERFVDQPSQAVDAADTLITRVMQARGYPVADLEAQAGLLSVDHPHVVENYRSGHAVWQRSQTQQTSTEDLREALLRYRSLFEELLRPDATGAAAPSRGQAGISGQALGPAEGDTGTAPAGPADGAAVPAPDAAAPEAGDPAYPEQPARGGRR